MWWSRWLKQNPPTLMLLEPQGQQLINHGITWEFGSMC
jgi:hypothetical protein